MSASAASIAAFKLLRVPTPLASYIYIYQHAEHLCYIEYMDGASALAKYLAPIDIVPGTTTVPRLLRTYDLWQLAKALQPHTSNPLSLNQIEDAIYEYLTQSR